MEKNAAYYTFLFLLVIQTGTSQEINRTKIDAKGSEMLLGKIDKSALTKEPYALWFNEQYEVYQVNSKIIKSIKTELNNHNITLFMGTWCGDSRREVPRVYKILAAANYPMDQLTVVALDYEKDQYKKSPGSEEKGLLIIKVPTLIINKKGKAINRIVESPIETWEKDLATILSGKTYVPHYNNMPTLPVD